MLNVNSYRSERGSIGPLKRSRMQAAGCGGRPGPESAPETEEDQEVARAGLPRRELRDAYALFVAAYRAAAEKLRAGIRDVVFPRGSFPPPMPFVG
jgi:hypothetical protein